MRAKERCISASAMLFKDRIYELKNRNNRNTMIRQAVCLLFFFFMLHLLFLKPSCAEVLDRVVAIVGEEVVLLSDFREAAERARKTGREVKDDEILNEMIDRLLLIEQAKKIGLGNNAAYRKAFDENVLIDEYLRRRVKVLIRIPFGNIESYYVNNQDRFKGRELNEVKGDIERHLIDREFEVKLREHIAELRQRSYIRVQLEEKK